MNYFDKIITIHRCNIVQDTAGITLGFDRQRAVDRDREKCEEACF